ncbi:MAG: carboxypeptidase-like regulatory domain-containing protein [Bacteroides sp.]|nr:carboxypeptidase-like regulatory domain-containing protein [Bacteroides sp.]
MENKSGKEGYTSKIPRISLFYRAMRIATLLLFSCSFSALADSTKFHAESVQQDKSEVQITGTILDETGEPIIGASVKVQSTGTGTITNLEGEFKLNVPKKGTIEISYIGYKTIKMVINEERNLRIVMESDTQALDEVVVVGY